MVRKKFGSENFEGVGAEATGSDSPPKPGSYVAKLRRLVDSTIQNGPNKGADRLRVGVEIIGPKNAKRVDGTSAIGAWVFSGLNVTEQGSGYVNQFLHAISGAKTKAQKTAVEKSFWGKGKLDGADLDDDDNVVKIGKDLYVGSPDGDITVGIVTRVRPDNREDHEGEKQADIARYLLPKSADEDDDDDEDDDEEDEDTEDDDEDEEDEESEEEESEDDSDERREELSELTLVKLKGVAKGAGLLAADIKGLDKDDLIDAIIDAESESKEEEEEEEEEEEPEEDERAEELGAMTLVALKKEGKAAGLTVADMKGLDKEDLIEAIQEAESEEDEDEAEEDDDADSERREELSGLSLIKLKAAAKKAGLSASDIKGQSQEELIESIIEQDVPF